MSEFTSRVISIIKLIPEGKVATYGQIAELSGHPRAARQVAGILKRHSESHDLPWHRVINSKGSVSIPSLVGRAEQIARLREENIKVDANGDVDLKCFLWKTDRV